MTSDQVYKLIEDNGLTLHGDIEHFATLVAEHEREACAKVCEAQEYDYWRASEEQDFTPQDCADAIRARGQA